MFNVQLQPVRVISSAGLAAGNLTTVKVTPIKPAIATSPATTIVSTATPIATPTNKLQISAGKNAFFTGKNTVFISQSIVPG